MKKEDTWWCCGVERSIEDRCSCGEKYEAVIYSAINEFQGKYRFLSNFWGSPIHYQGLLFPTVEHFYQAMKSKNLCSREFIAGCSTPSMAKKLGEKLVLRLDWEDIKLDVMEYALRIKFCKGSVLRKKLLATYPYELIEGNYWNNKFSGVCLKTGKGRNELGKLLIQLRLEFINENQ